MTQEPSHTRVIALTPVAHSAKPTLYFWLPHVPSQKRDGDQRVVSWASHFHSSPHARFL